MTPLAGLRVLDLTLGPAGGIATMILADFGAEVVKVEPPGGDPFRRLAAAPMWLRGKQSVVLDLKTESGRAAVHELARGADAAVVGLRPGTAERLGVAPERLHALNPQLVVCGLTGFGHVGPYRDYRAYDAVVEAKAGRMQLFAGQPRRDGPVYAAVQLATHAAAQATVQGILAALLVRGRTGRGQVVRTSLLQGTLPYDMAGLATRHLTQTFPDRFPTDPLAAYNRQPTLQYQPVLCADGRWIQLGNLLEHLFHAFIRAAGMSDIYADPRFANAPYLGDEAREALRAVMLERMRARPSAEWMAAFVADGNVAAEPIVTAQEALSHPQMRHNGDVIDLEHPRLGRVTQLGPVARLRQTPAAIAAESPEVGEHDAERLAAWRDASSVAGAGRGVPAPDAPLAGVTVVELATIIAAPLGCALLGDLGARVIKIESPEGDPLRTLGNGVSAVKTCASKESICVDLKKPEGQAIAREIIAGADVLVHNFRPGVPERLGFGYEEIRAINPGIVYVNAMGYGTDGPYALRPSAHPVAGAACGGALLQAGGGWPPTVETVEEIKEAARWFTRANETNPDPSTSMVIATAAMLGLYARRVHGVGQQVDVNMFLANAYANADDFLAYAGKPPRPLVDADLYGLNALWRLYPAADGWVFLACPTDGEWRSLCAALDRDDLAADPRFATRGARREHDAALASELATTFARQAADEWERLLTAAGIGCVRASGMAPGGFLAEDAHVRANRFVREVEHPRWGPMLRHGPVAAFEETPERPGPGSLAGQHTDAILRELDYDEGRIAALRADGVVASAAADS